MFALDEGKHIFGIGGRQACLADVGGKLTDVVHRILATCNGLTSIDDEFGNRVDAVFVKRGDIR